MKICFIAGASSVHTVKWVNAMVKLKHSVSLITIHDINFDDFIDTSVDIYKLKFTNKFGYYLNYFEVRKLLKKIQPDIVNVHYASGYGTLARLVRFKPTLLSVWGSDVYLFPYRSKMNEKIIKRNLKCATQIASTSRAMSEQTKLFVKPSLPIAITPFGVDLNLFSPKKKIENDYIIIGTVKRLKKIYGIDILIRSFSKLIEKLKDYGYVSIAEKIRLEIVGEGPELPNLQGLVDELNLSSKVNFVGNIQNNEVPNYLNKFDIYCAFSLSESFGVSVIEASACEVPVVVSDVGGLPEVVQDGITGYLVNNKNIEGTALRLLELVINKEKRIEMGRKGREFVRNNYDWNENIVSMEQIYNSLIEKYQK